MNKLNKDKKKAISTGVVAIECVVLEWNAKHYLLPIALMEEALILDPKAVVGAQYRWRNIEIPLMTLDGQKMDSNNGSNGNMRLKIAILHARSPSYPFIGVCFQNEAKQVSVRESELYFSWQDAANNVAILNQPRLNLPVTIFKSSKLQ